MQTISFLWYEPPIFFYILVIAPVTYLAYRAWSLALGQPRAGLRAALLTLAFAVLDLVVLSGTRWLGWAYPAVMVPYLGLTLSRLVPVLIFSLPASKAARLGRPHPNFPRWVLPALGALYLCGSLLLAYSIYIEPYRIQVSQVSLPGPGAAVGQPLRIVHITDLHIGPISSRETDMIAKVNALQPDLILLTGDYLFVNTSSDPQGWENLRTVLSQLQARYGIYAVAGSPMADQPLIDNNFFASVDNVTLLDDAVQPFLFPDGLLYLVGVTNIEIGRDTAALEHLMADIPPEAYTILLYHVPTLASAAAETGVDLFLAGHTHGWQVDLPPVQWVYSLYMPYSRGQDQLGDTTIYVNRGIGLESIYLPGVRLLCPPEILLLEISPAVR